MKPSTWIVFTSLTASVVVSALAFALISENETTTSAPERFEECHLAGMPQLGDWLDKPIEDRRLSDGSFIFGNRADMLMPVISNEAIEKFDWEPIASKIASHREIWEMAGELFPSAERQVLIHQTSFHYVSALDSYVASSDEEGHWEITRITILYLGDEELEEIGVNRSILLGENARALDLLLSDSCLHSEPRQTDYSYIWSSTAPVWTMEFKGVNAGQPLQRRDSGFGRTALIYHLLSLGAPH